MVHVLHKHCLAAGWLLVCLTFGPIQAGDVEGHGLLSVEVAADGSVRLLQKHAKPTGTNVKQAFTETRTHIGCDDRQLADMVNFWNTFRDPDNGLYCDSIYFGGTTVCGPSNNFYSLASVGMGLVLDAVFAELGFLSRSAAQARALQTIEAVISSWPRAAGTSFFQHFTDRSFGAVAEYSTIDTAIGALGALFAGDYFGGEVAQKARTFARTPKWTAAIKGTESPGGAPTGAVPSSCAGHINWGYTHGKSQQWYIDAYGGKMYRISGASLQEGSIEDFQRLYKCLGLNSADCNDNGLDFPITCTHAPCDTCLDSTMHLSSSKDGQMQGTLKPFNEYYMLAYLATKTDLTRNDTTAANLELATRYFSVFFGSDSAPAGDGTYPVSVTYNGFDLLSDHPSNFIPSFHVQFCYFLTKAFGASSFYSQLFSDSMKADMKFWELALSGHQYEGKVWGLGAGIAPAGYQANSISSNSDLVFSAPIMAGFLKADSTNTAFIISQLRDLYDNDICTYQKTLPDGSATKIVWRCSINQPSWNAHRVESIDFSTMVLGFNLQYLRDGFYQDFAA